MDKEFVLSRNLHDEDFDVLYQGYKVASVHFVHPTFGNVSEQIADAIAAIPAKPGAIRNAQVTHCPICKADPCVCEDTAAQAHGKSLRDVIYSHTPPAKPLPGAPGFPGIGRSLDDPSLRKYDDSADLMIQLDVIFDLIRIFVKTLVGELKS